MSGIVINGSNVGSVLSDVLMCDAIVPGSDVSYQLCKTIYEYHALGKKMVDTPIKKAQSQKREIVVPAAPADSIKEAFERQRLEDKCDTVIATVAQFARQYGIGALTLIVDGLKPGDPLDLWKLSGAKIGYNCLDPLNTAGSMTLNQDPNSIDFQKTANVTVQGQAYHPSRSAILMHERPIYISYTGSAFGYTGRSVYQRALFPLKTFLQTMITDDMVAKKAGLLVAKIKAPGSIIDKAMATLNAAKRNLLLEAQTGNVLTVGAEDAIETLNMQQLEGPAKMARDNAIDNVAASADMPAMLLKSDTLTQGFGEGTEDAKAVAEYTNGIREWLAPLYEFCDQITMHRAWTEEFYATIQNTFPDEYGSKPYKEAFYEWKNSFKAEWPSLITEPDSEKIKVDETRYKAALGLVEALLPQCDPDNKATLLMWAADVFNEQKILFPKPLVLDYEALANFTPPTPAEPEKEPSPSQSFADSEHAPVRRLERFK